MRVLRFGLILFMALIANLVWAVPNFPELTGRVVDQAGLLSQSEKADLNAKLANFESKSNTRVVVAIVTSLERQNASKYGPSLWEYWDLGAKDAHDYVLLLVAPKELKAWIEVSDGLDDDLSELLAQSIFRNNMLPLFKAGKMAESVVVGVDKIMQSLNGELTIEKIYAESKALKDGEDKIADYISVGFMLLFFGIVIFIISKIVRNRNIKFTRDMNVTDHLSSGGSSSGSDNSGGSSGGGASGGW